MRPKKIKLPPGFPTPSEVAKTLGMTREEIKSVEEILNRPLIRSGKRGSRRKSILEMIASRRSVR